MLGVPHKSQHRFICWDHSVAAASASSFAYAASISCFFNAWRSSRLALAAFTFIRRASAWSLNSLARFLSAFFLWMYSIRTRLFLNTLPLTFK